MGIFHKGAKGHKCLSQKENSVIASPRKNATRRQTSNVAKATVITRPEKKRVYW